MLKRCAVCGYERAEHVTVIKYLNGTTEVLPPARMPMRSLLVGDTFVGPVCWSFTPVYHHEGAGL